MPASLTARLSWWSSNMNPQGCGTSEAAEFRGHICVGKPRRGAESHGPLPEFVPEAQAATFTCLFFSRVLLVR